MILFDSSAQLTILLLTANITNPAVLRTPVFSINRWRILSTERGSEIFHEALEEKKYTCFLKEDTYLPMMYMPDAIRATIELMEAPASAISVRTSYNLSGISFSPKEIAAQIKKHIPDFSISYTPDYRQAIADSWPQNIDDSVARKDWGWKEEYDLAAMTEDMLTNL